jgi:hypothetical protein
VGFGVTLWSKVGKDGDGLGREGNGGNGREWAYLV